MCPWTPEETAAPRLSRARPLPTGPAQSEGPAAERGKAGRGAMKFDVNVLRYLSKEEFRVLTAVEMGMRNVSGEAVGEEKGRGRCPAEPLGSGVYGTPEP